MTFTPKQYRTGTHRVVPPEQTLARVRPHFPAMGITRIANVTGLDIIGIHVVMVARPNSRSLAVTQGKGLDLASAKASGVMEAVESYHAEHITLPLKLGSVRELGASHPLIGINRLPRLSISRFHSDLQLLWIQGHNLINDNPVWIPFELVHTNYQLPLPTGSGSFMMSTNGLASGNHVLEAISHGICELIERDATSLWQQSPERDLCRIDLSTIDDADCRAVIDAFERAGTMVAVWDTTTDIGVPSFYASIIEREPEPGRQLYPSSGAGCHPDCGIALARALTEAAQTRLTYISGARDDTSLYEYQAARDVDAQHSLRAWMQPRPNMRSFADVSSHASESFEQDITWMIERLQSVGIEEVAIVDLTRPEFRIPVVRMVIPGLEGIHDVPGYVPGVRARRQNSERSA